MRYKQKPTAARHARASRTAKAIPAFAPVEVPPPVAGTIPREDPPFAEDVVDAADAGAAEVVTGLKASGPPAFEGGEEVGALLDEAALLLTLLGAVEEEDPFVGVELETDCFVCKKL